MLQQTNVEIVIPVYLKFLQKFPTLHDLSIAPLESVTQITDQLGYTRRGRFLHKIAKEIMLERKGIFPSKLEDLLSLKGIGRYTAGAILSFAYEKNDRTSALVDVNVERVFSRIFGLWEMERNTKFDKIIWSLAESYVDSGDVWIKNQAIMDLGATVCLAKKPKCYVCPMKSFCQYYHKVMPKYIALDAFFG
jgi:A/G-specific adenine glycosylase